MVEENRSDIWGLSLSLRPPITNIDYNNNNNNHKPLCKREPHFSADEQRKSRKQNKTAPQLVIDLEEVDMTKVDSPNSTLSSATGKRAGCFRGGDVISDDDEGGSAGGGGGNNRDGSERKKLRLSKEQIIVLEQAFREHTTLNTKQKMTLARQVNLRPRQVEVWFQNRRARTKLKQTEVDCEYLRRFCESLTEQNRKLQKEVQELRSLKLPPGHGKNHPGSTVSMCPSCKAVSVSSSSAPSTNNGVLHRPIPLNLKKLSLTLNNNHNSNNNNNDNDNDKMLKSHLPHG